MACATLLPTGTAVVGIGLLVDAHATTATFATCAVAAASTGAGTTDTGFAGSTNMPTLPTVIGIALRVGAAITATVGGIARTAGAVAFLPAIGADAGTILTGFIGAASMPTGATVGMIGAGIDTGAVTLGLPRWTHTLSIGTDLVGATDMTTTATVARIAAQIGTGALTTPATTALSIDVAANPIGLTVRQGDADATETKQASHGGSEGFEGRAS